MSTRLPAACWDGASRNSIGKPMHETIHFQDADRHPIPAEGCTLLAVRLQGRTLRSSDDTFTRKDGSTFAVAFSSAPLLSEANIEGVVVVFRDITDEKKEQSRGSARTGVSQLGRPDPRRPRRGPLCLVLTAHRAARPWSPGRRGASAYGGPRR